MLGGTAKRQRIFIIALNPETFFAPGYGRQRPAIRGGLGEKIGHRNLKRINADAAA